MNMKTKAQTLDYLNSDSSGPDLLWKWHIKKHGSDLVKTYI
jgi:hypothetical protein